MSRRLGQEIPQLVVGATLDRERGPLHFQGRMRLGSRIAHRSPPSHGVPSIYARLARAPRPAIALLTSSPSGEQQVEHLTLAVGAYSQEVASAGTRIAFSWFPHPWIPAVENRDGNGSRRVRRGSRCARAARSACSRLVEAMTPHPSTKAQRMHQRGEGSAQPARWCALR